MVGTVLHVQVIPFWAAHCAEQHRVALPAGFHELIGQSDTLRIEQRAPDQVVREGKIQPVMLPHGFQHLNGLAGDFRSDPVSGQYGDVMQGRRSNLNPIVRCSFPPPVPVHLFPSACLRLNGVARFRMTEVARGPSVSNKTRFDILSILIKISINICFEMGHTPEGRRLYTGTAVYTRGSANEQQKIHDIHRSGFRA